ncbi:MAG: glycosyltransferase family 4 protein [Candidatus Hodarchaeota archaeon]
MRIGFVSTWFERGAAYVTRAYIEALKDVHDVYVYARGGEYFSKKDPNWDHDYVTWGLRLGGTSICWRHFKKWVNSNNIEIVFFNEQKDLDIITRLKQKMPQLKIGSYIDYYKLDTIESFNLYDFLICNTERHYSVFKDHSQSFYVPWGVDTNFFKPKEIENDKEQLVFFHSAGVSARKGTDILVKAFIDGGLFKKSRLIIHTQSDLRITYGLHSKKLKEFNIEIIHKTVPPPGLYYLGDIYVYPTYLEGLGLTIYEAMASGLPVITTNYAPMNEIVDDEVGKLVQIEKIVSRQDGYYWPLTICNKGSLIDAMQFYLDNFDEIKKFKQKARKKAYQDLEWSQRYEKIREIFLSTQILERDKNEVKKFSNQVTSAKKRSWKLILLDQIPFCTLKHVIWTRHEKKSRKFE